MIQYSPKLTFGPEAADWQERFNPERMRRQRFERAQVLMRKYGIAALLEANHHNIRYLTALKGFAYPMCRYVLFFAEHDAVMYEHDGYYHQMPDQCPVDQGVAPGALVAHRRARAGRLRGRSKSFRRRNQKRAGKAWLARRKDRPWRIRRQRARSLGQRGRKKYRRCAQSNPRSAHGQKPMKFPV
jgi:Xaa-Pro aminopeptidase